MSTAGLGIFVKTPSLSPVKTRLWRDIGQRCAESFHLASAEAVASVSLEAQTRAGLTAYWAVAEPEAMRGEVWSDLPRMAQGKGSLGRRMEAVHRQLLGRHHAAILIGADAPQISVERLTRAVSWLAAADPRLVIGRARDGGFWLFGSNVALPTAAWTGIRYSTPNTASEFVGAMHSYGKWLELDRLGDVDTFDDFAPILNSIEALPAPTDAQRRLAAWMAEVIRRGHGCP